MKTAVDPKRWTVAIDGHRIGGAASLEAARFLIDNPYLPGTAFARDTVTGESWRRRDALWRPIETPVALILEPGVAESIRIALGAEDPCPLASRDGRRVYLPA